MAEHLLQEWGGTHLEVTGVLHRKSKSWSHPQQFTTDHSLRSRGMVQNCDQSHLAGDERQAHSYHPSSIHLESKLFHLLVQGMWLFPHHQIIVSHSISFPPVTYSHPEFSSRVVKGKKSRSTCQNPISLPLRLV